VSLVWLGLMVILLQLAFCGGGGTWGYVHQRRVRFAESLLPLQLAHTAAS